MLKQTCLLMAAAAAMLAVQPGNLVAGVTVFDNYGPGWSYTYNMGKNVSGYMSSTGECHTAAGFVPTAGGKVTDVWLTVGLDYGPNILKVALLDSNYNGMPAAEMAAWTVQDAMQPVGQTGQTPLHWLLADGPTLVQGNTYWIACSPGDDYMAAGWYFNAIGEIGCTAQRKHVVDTWKLLYGSDHPAFRVDVTPEPATLALVALGGLVALRRRR